MVSMFWLDKASSGLTCFSSMIGEGEDYHHEGIYYSKDYKPKAVVPDSAALKRWGRGWRCDTPFGRYTTTRITKNIYYYKYSAYV